MPDNRFICGPNSGNTREPIVIEANRVLDSCRDRDCYENVRVYLTECGSEIIERTSSVRVKKACLAWTNITVDPVQFNRGFYTVDIKYYVKLEIEACTCPGRAQEFEGIAILDKRCVLFGGDSNTKIFRSTPGSTDFCRLPETTDCVNNVPSVVVEAVDPIVLGSKVVEKPLDKCCNCCCCDIPDMVTSTLSSPICDSDNGKGSGRYLAVSFGLFSVIRMIRPSQYLINATEFNVPDKECVCGMDNDPCSIFKNMAFPTNEFNPPVTPCAPVHGDKGKCGCQGN